MRTIWFLLLLLAACGGDGGDPATPVKLPETRAGLMQLSTRQFEALSALLEGLSDEASAEAARARLSALTEQYRRTRAAAKALQDSKEARKAAADEFGHALVKAITHLGRAFKSAEKNAAVAGVLGEEFAALRRALE